MAEIQKVKNVRNHREKPTVNGKDVTVNPLDPNNIMELSKFYSDLIAVPVLGPKIVDYGPSNNKEKSKYISFMDALKLCIANKRIFINNIDNDKQGLFTPDHVTQQKINKIKSPKKNDHAEDNSKEES